MTWHRRPPPPSEIGSSIWASSLSRTGRKPECRQPGKPSPLTSAGVPGPEAARGRRAQPPADPGGRAWVDHRAGRTRTGCGSRPSWARSGGRAGRTRPVPKNEPMSTGTLVSIMAASEVCRRWWSRTAGVDRVIPAFIADDADIVACLGNTREQLKTRTFTPLPVRERMTPGWAAGEAEKVGHSHRDRQACGSLTRAGPGTDRGDSPRSTQAKCK
jgi:hypothetical protein